MFWDLGLGSPLGSSDVFRGHFGRVDFGCCWRLVERLFVIGGGPQHSIEFEGSLGMALLEGRRPCGAVKVRWDFVLT